ncbi:hypothetical protein PMAYCL1PPCAC_05462, partial [Pristionchus mayeri]
NSCLWNINFTNYTRHIDGRAVKMDTMHVDTGMRLEDLACVVQGVSSVFETDLFRPIIRKIEQVSLKKYNERRGADPRGLDYSFRVVADSMRFVCVAATECSPTTSHHARFIVNKQAQRAAWLAVNVLKAPRNSLEKLVPVVTKSPGVDSTLLSKATGDQEKLFWAFYEEERCSRPSHWNDAQWFFQVVEKKEYAPSRSMKAIKSIRGIVGF